MNVSDAPAVTAPTAPERVGRDGRLDLRFERRGEETVLARCRWTLPLQVLAPLALGGPAAVVSVLNPTGGLVGGDRLRLDVALEAGAHACLTTPSATRVYRTGGAIAVQETTARLGRDATLEWVPDHTIPSAGAAFRQTLTVDVAHGARLVAVDAWAAGRIARGEAWRFACLESALTVGDGEGPILHDRWRLAGGPDWDGLGFTEGHPYFATMVVVADHGLDAFCADVGGLAGVASARLAAGRLPRRGVLVRCLAPTAPALTEAMGRAWTAARHRTLGLPPLALRKG